MDETTCKRDGGTWTDMGDGTWECIFSSDEDMGSPESDDSDDGSEEM